MKRWTLGEVRAAILARKDGEIVKRIAVELGRSYHSVAQKLIRKRVKRPQITQTVLTLYRLGLDRQTTARRLDISVNAVSEACRRLRQLGHAIPDGRAGRDMSKRRRQIVLPEADSAHRS